MRLTALDDAAWRSPWRGVRTGDKVMLGLALTLTALLAPTWPGTPAVTVVAVALLVTWAAIPPRVLAAAAAAPLAFVTIGALSVAIQVGEPAGPVWWRAGLLSMGPESGQRAVGLLGHGIAGTLSVLVIATTTPMVDVIGWLARWRVPAAALDIAALTYRMLFSLADSLAGIREAQLARLGGTSPGSGSLRRRLDTASRTAGTVLLRTWTRARRLEEGLAGRGFESGLVTLPTDRPRSPRLVAVGTIAVAGVWACCFAAGSLSLPWT